LLCADPLEPGASVRVVIYDTVMGQPLARQWSGCVTHAHTALEGCRVGIRFEWPTGRGAQPVSACPPRANPHWPRAGAGEPRNHPPIAALGDPRTLAWALAGFAADQLGKSWADSSLGAVDLVPGFLSIVPVANPGGFASLGEGFAWTPPLCALCGLALAGLWAASLESPTSEHGRLSGNWWADSRATGVGLIAAGVLGNSADRLVLGHVRDFLVCDLLPHWAFNVADFLLLTGALTLLGGQRGRAGDPTEPL
jgi:lipoprotein signal peptidase